MSTTYYRLYKEKVMELAKSLVIKNETAAHSYNQYLETLGYTISDDPTTWKYYQNLAGQYHALDRQMEIVSLDTLETITFSKENLKIHLATAEEYRVGSRYYKALVEQYPDQELLIRGILTPVDIHTAINAEDFTVLYADPTLIERNETNLVYELQQRIWRFSTRWDVPGYQATDDLYNSSQLAILYLNLPMFIMNIRLANCRTAYAHSFHIREYLASHGKLDRYLDQLTKKQMLFLYRNILYIERNAGKQETFDWLVERLLTDRGIPLAEYTARHNLEKMPESLYPDLEFKRIGLNRHHNPSSTNERTLIQMLELEESEAPGNTRVLDKVIERDTKRFRNSRIDQLPTKVLESAIVDRSDSGFVTNQDYLLNHWLYWSTTGRYLSMINVPDPRSGERFQINTRDAFILFLYAYNQSVGIELPRVPDVTAKMVRKDVLPTREELRYISEREYVSEETITQALERNPPIVDYVSTQAFIEAINKVYDRAIEHRFLYSSQQHYKSRGQVQAICDHLYKNVECRLVEEETLYSDWLRIKGFDFSTMTVLEFELLANNILEEATGLSLFGSRSMVELQDSLIKLMQQLSSYSIQFLKEINRGPILVYDWSVIRLGDIDGEAGDTIRVRTATQRVKELHAKGIARFHVDASRFNRMRFGLHGRYGIRWDPTIRFKLRTKDTITVRTRLPMVRWELTDNDVDPDWKWMVSPSGFVAQ